jgi:hypothetical protein
MRHWLLSFDVVAVLGFALAGRRAHDEAGSVSGFLETAAPFLIGLAVGWLAVRAWREPEALLTGVVSWAGAWGIGLLLRRFAWSESTALTFVFVAAGFLALFVMGWRLVARWRIG